MENNIKDFIEKSKCKKPTLKDGVIIWNAKTKTVFHDDGTWTISFNDNGKGINMKYPNCLDFYINYLKTTFPKAFK